MNTAPGWLIDGMKHFHHGYRDFAEQCVAEAEREYVRVRAAFERGEASPLDVEAAALRVMEWRADLRESA